MATQSTHVRVGVNFASSGQEHFICAYSTVDPSDIIVAKWHLVRPEVVVVIKQLPWAVLSVVRGSYSSPQPTFGSSTAPPEKHPIILVGAPAGSQDSWRGMAERIYSLCRNAGLEHAHVLFESVRFPLTVTDLLEPSGERFPEAAGFAENVPMGSSFGPVEEKMQTSASMGGSIKLQGDDDAEPLTLLLSVFHPFASLVKEGELLHGCCYDSALAIKSRIPSAQDINCEREFCQNWIDQVKEQIELTNQNFELFGEEKFRTRADSLEERLKEQEARLQKLQERTLNDRGSGILQFGSGFERGLDWSLSSFEDRNINNDPPTSEDFAVAVQKTQMDYEASKPALKRAGSREAIELSSTSRGFDGLAMKRGRTTGLTIGKVNSLPSDFVISKSLKLKKEVSFEVRAVLSGVESSLVAPGDSGAWFLNTNSEWIGSLIGSHNPMGCGAFALVLDAEQIVKDIEAFTGKKVVSPKRSKH